MKRFFSFLACLVTLPITLVAAATAEQLFPADTWAIIGTRDFSTAKSNFDQSPAGQLWADPAIKPFKEKFLKKLQADMLDPLQQQLGIRYSDYLELLQGEFAIAATPPAGEDKSSFGFILLLDSRDKKEMLRTNLTALRKQWNEGGYQVRTDKIRDIEFSTITFTGEQIDALVKKAFPGPTSKEEEEEKAEPKKHQLTVGQVDSLLLIANNTRDLEKVVAKHGGGVVTTLGDQAPYQANANLFKDAIYYGWVNLAPLISLVSSAELPPGAVEQGMSPDKILTALGIKSLNSIAFKAAMDGNGTFVEGIINAPEAKREGLLKMLTPAPKEAGPLPIIPVEAVTFKRVRFDFQAAWANLENILSKMNPTYSGMLQLMLSSAGKDKDPEFDLKKNLIGNLGDDFISYEKAPRQLTAEALQNAPSLGMVGSPNADQLLNAVKVVSSLLPEPIVNGPAKDRELLGKKVISIPTMSMTTTGEMKPGAFEVVSSGGYLLFSTDSAVLEESLRAGETPVKSLREKEGFADAAQKVGGLQTGWFGYENDFEMARATIETFRQDPNGVSLWFMSAGSKKSPEEQQKVIKEWFDFSLLPPFGQISKYFNFSVYAVSGNQEGISMKAWSPTSPAMKK